MDKNYSDHILKSLSGRKWVEVECQYLTNQPLVWIDNKKVPDPKVKPNKAYLFCWIAKRTKRRIERKRILKVIKTNSDNLVYAVEDFCSQHVIVKSPDNPNNYHGEPDIF